MKFAIESLQIYVLKPYMCIEAYYSFWQCNGDYKIEGTTVMMQADNCHIDRSGFKKIIFEDLALWWSTFYNPDSLWLFHKSIRRIESKHVPLQRKLRQKSTFMRCRGKLDRSPQS